VNLGSRIYSFEELEVYKAARELRKMISKLIKTFPSQEKFRLTDQLLRSSRSITANIAEGFGRFHYQENIQFCRQARGSLNETLDHLSCALDELYIKEDTFVSFRDKIIDCQKILNGYIAYLKKAANKKLICSYTHLHIMKTKFPPIKEQLEVIRRGTVDLLPMDELKQKLERSIKTGKPLRIKQGFDPTAPDIHLGHTVGIRKLKQFQDLGHQIVVIIGDYTGMVGDPSEKSATRPRLTYDEVMKNAKTYKKQFFKILDPKKTEMVYNGQWFSKMRFDEIMGLASKFTVARMLERDDFAKRYESQLPISIHEFFYPLMQGYDSVMIKADVEIGATEQKFNLIIARQIQKEYGQGSQIVLTLPVLVGIDGVQRMSKSTGNYIGIDEKPEEMYGKTMRIPDEQIYPYFELITDVELSELKKIKNKLKYDSVNPRDLKRQLARKIVEMYHSEKAAKDAEAHFDKIHIKKEVPDEIPEFKLSGKSRRIIDIIVDAKLAASKGEARRLVKQKAVTLDGKLITDEFFELSIKNPTVLKVGKRKFIKLVTK
jgi:tyrosyl-tRNA synthetase